MTTKAKSAEPQAEINAAMRKEDAKFPIERLREDCLELFGVPAATFDGAMYDMGDELTIAEAKQRIEKWKNAKINSTKTGGR